MKHSLEQEIKSIITQQQPILWIISLLPISATEMGWAPWVQAIPMGSWMVSMSFSSFPCHCCHETLVLFGLMFLQLIFHGLQSWLAQPMTLHEVTQKAILELKTISLTLLSYRLSNVLIISVTATITGHGSGWEANQLEEKWTDVNWHQSCMVRPHRGHQQHSPASGCGPVCCSPASEGSSQQTRPLGITTMTTDRCSTWSTASWDFTSLSKRELRSTDLLLTSSVMTWCLLQVVVSSLIHVLAQFQLHLCPFLRVMLSCDSTYRNKATSVKWRDSRDDL